MDILAATGGLLASIPLQLLTASLVLVSHGRPVLFRQQRPGLHGEVFELVKFRTMLRPDAFHKTDSERLTRVGRFLRSTSLDELPTLWNVLRGDMSIVGPRPLLVHYLHHYTPEQARRHEVRPGVTGLAQAAGRNAVSWTDRLKLDVAYVDQRCALLDSRILLQTLRIVLTRQGVAEPGHATMSEFTGSEATADGAN